MYFAGDQVYDHSITWVALSENIGSKPCDFNEDTNTCAENSDWLILEESEFTEIGE